ncbi:MAG TPA: DsrE/DsrF/DrsH-like family protein [Thermodesulfovibrionales bacterium]|jgi:peroxiredoxin family protein|nr:DsrE/DsrF/DrsH-like family protein [Thermodesulfovibrionales bacterium]
MDQVKKESAAFITSKDTLDGAYPGLILGINARRLGMQAKVFYTFMGINVIRKGWAEKAKFQPSGFMGAIPGMSAIATWMMKEKIEKAQIPSLPDLQEMAMLEGVEFIACKMTIDMMDLKQEDFIEGVVIQSAEDFLRYAKDCKICLYT